jgi:geranylgeranyl diphosphate synthase type I
MRSVSGRRKAAGRCDSKALVQASAQVERAMRTFIDSQPLGDFYDLLRYQLGWLPLAQGGSAQAAPRHVAAALSLLTAKACGGRVNTVMPLAVCLGLLREFVAIQQDVEYARATHGGRPTVWRVWGRAQALNAADGVHALAKVALLESRRRLPPAVVLRLAEEVDACWLRICEAAPASMQRGRQSAARLQLAPLCACACYGGCLAAGGDDSMCGPLREFGELLGRQEPASRRRALAALDACGLPAPRKAVLAGLVCELDFG